MIVCYIENEWSETIAEKFVEIGQGKSKRPVQISLYGNGFRKFSIYKKYKNFKT
jgi:hypothetical protein